jgi:hypothetical protein
MRNAPFCQLRLEISESVHTAGPHQQQQRHGVARQALRPFQELVDNQNMIEDERGGILVLKTRESKRETPPRAEESAVGTKSNTA